MVLRLVQGYWYAPLRRRARQRRGIDRGSSWPGGEPPSGPTGDATGDLQRGERGEAAVGIQLRDGERVIGLVAVGDRVQEALEVTRQGRWAGGRCRAQGRRLRYAGVVLLRPGAEQSVEHIGGTGHQGG